MRSLFVKAQRADNMHAANRRWIEELKMARWVEENDG